MYNIFGRDSGAQLTVSAGVGYQREDFMEEPGDPTNFQGFANDSAVMSYRTQYRQKLFEEKLEILSALWFQHVLYAPGNSSRPTQFFHVKNYRVYGHLQVKLKITEIRDHISVYLNLEGKLEYYAVKTADSPWDLMLTGGLGAAF